LQFAPRVTNALRPQLAGTTIETVNERSMWPQNASKSRDIEHKDLLVDGNPQRIGSTVQIGVGLLGLAD
jgi:hypothetical protein